MIKELQEFLEVKSYHLAAEFAETLELSEIVKSISEMNEEDVVPFCRALPSELLADVLVELEKEDQAQILAELRDDELDEVMDEISVDDTVDIIEDMPEEVQRRIAEEEEIVSMLRDKKFSVLKPLLASMNEIDIAEIFEELDENEIPILFRILPKDLAADTFVELNPDAQETLLKKLNDAEIKSIMDEMFVDDTVDLIEEMPANVVKRVLALTDKETRENVNQILKYPKDSAGSIMTVEYVYFYEGTSVSQAFDKIRSSAIDSETIYTCYVVSTKNKLLGTVSAKDLMLSKGDVLVDDIMVDNLIYGHTLDDKEDVARKIQEYGFLAIPIVDKEMRMVGIVTYDDAMDVLREENTEDFAKMAAIKATDIDTPYIKQSIFSIWKNRAPWLLVLMISATFTGLILNVYESQLNAISIALFACVPMIMDTGGNAGAQASVTVIRSLALRELETKDILKVLWKEIRVSLLLGITLAIACFAKLMLIDGLFLGSVVPDYPVYEWSKCLLVSFALFITIVIAKIVGCTLPLAAKACKLDPAVVASPFITTIVDALSLIIYCSIAVAILG